MNGFEMTRPNRISHPPLWVDTLDTSVFGVDTLGKVTVWNQATEKLTGYSAEEMMGHTLAMEGCETAIAMLLSYRSSSELSVALRSKQGRYIDVKIRASTQHSHSGELEGLIFLAEATLPTTCINGNGRCNCRSPENSFTEKANTPMFGISRDGLVTFWNRKAEEVTGVSQEQVLQTKFLTYLSESDGEAFLEYLRHLEGGLLPPNFSVNFPRSSGQPLKLLLNVSLWEEDQYFIIAHELPCLLGDADVLLTTFPDVVHEIRMLIDQVNIPVFGVDVNGDVNEWNEKMVKLTGFSKFEAFDVNFVQTFVTPKLQHGLADIFRNAVNGIGTSTYELELETKEGEVRVILLNISTRRNVRGEVVGVLCVAEDIPVTAQHDFTVAATARELRQLVDTANVPIFGIDVDGNVNEWNEKTAEITGFSAEEAFKRPLVATFVVRKLREAVQDMFNKAVHGHGTCNYELEMCTKGGESRTLLVNAAARRDIEKRIVGVVVVAHDVTEESKHARAVAAWASELRQLIDTANVPIFGIDADGDVNEWNDQMAEITGFTKSEAFDCNLVETFIVSSFRDSVEEVLKNALEGKGTSNYELEFQTKSNDIRHLLVNATTRRDADGNINGVLGVAQDVSEAVQRDRAVASMASELRLLIETANAPIFGIDCEGNVNEWNKKISEISGYEEEEAFDEPLVDVFIVARMRHQVQGIMNKALRGIETTNFELEMIAKTGDLRILLVNATTRRDPDGKVVGVVMVGQDVTDDRKHSQQLREMQYLRASQEAKVETERNMTAYFAHELRNPLGAIDSALNAMPDDLPQSAKDLVQGMQLCSGFMSSIMNNLLDVRKMEEGKMKLNSVPMSLAALVDSVHAMLLPSVRPGVDFRKKCRIEGKDWVLGDPHRIQQVMTNVITNAIKYTTSGSITISVHWENIFVRLEVADTGPGIPRSEQKKLFERYVQRGGAPGTGLGLAIAKHLVDLTGGSIEFESDPSVKAGTSCIILMPLPECDPPDFVVEDDDNLIESELTFLIIDDVKMNRTMLKRRIQKGIAPNAIIREASTGEEALLICGTEKFDVIVVDQYMEEAGGVMVGTDVVFAMRRMRIDSIIIGCSGNDMDEQFQEAGADWVWKKPMPSNSKIIADIRCAMLQREREV